MIFDHGVGSYCAGAIKSIPQVTPVRSDLTEIIEPTQRECSLIGSSPGDPHLAVVEQPEGAAGHVGAGELHARPLPADEFRFGNRDHLADVPPVDLQQGRAGILDVCRSGGRGDLGYAVSVHYAVGVQPEVDEGGAVLRIGAVLEVVAWR